MLHNSTTDAEITVNSMEQYCSVSYEVFGKCANIQWGIVYKVPYLSFLI